jgi:sarcosine oxidase gamma subunit
MIFGTVYSAHSAARNRTQRETDTTIRGKSVDLVLASGCIADFEITKPFWMV